MTKYFTKDGDDYVEVSEQLHTQEHLDQIVKERAERVARNQFGDYDDLKEKAKKVDTITQEYEDKIKTVSTEKSELEKQLGAAKLETDKVKIVHEFKLSDELSEFVTGNTVDEMRQRAEKLAKGFKGGNLNLDKNKKPDEKQTDTKALVGKLFGKKSDD